jgi:hypothetical protein
MMKLKALLVVGTGMLVIGTTSDSFAGGLFSKPIKTAKYKAPAFQNFSESVELSNNAVAASNSALDADDIDLNQYDPDTNFAGGLTAHDHYGLRLDSLDVAHAEALESLEAAGKMNELKGADQKNAPCLQPVVFHGEDNSYMNDSKMAVAPMPAKKKQSMFNKFTSSMKNFKNNVKWNRSKRTYVQQ